MAILAHLEIKKALKRKRQDYRSNESSLFGDEMLRYFDRNCC
jgi:hypothetical protein